MKRRVTLSQVTKIMGATNWPKAKMENQENDRLISTGRNESNKVLKNRDRLRRPLS